MIDQPQISVIIPAYNAAATVSAAIQSAKAQESDVLSVEVVVADDQSADETARVAKDAGADHVVTLEQNQGSAGARNAAIEAATGDVIAVLDADDAYEPQRLTNLLTLLKAENADIVADNMLVVDGAREYPMFQLAAPVELTLAGLADGDHAMIRGFGYGYLKPMFTRAIKDRLALAYDRRIKIVEDYFFLATALAAGAKMMIHPSPTYRYTVHSGSISYGKPEAFEYALEAEERFQAQYTSFNSETAQALARRRRSLEDAVSYVRFADAVKRQDWRAAASQMIRNPRATRFLGRSLQKRATRFMPS